VDNEYFGLFCGHVCKFRKNLIHKKVNYDVNNNPKNGE
jgi:hypothetical protein